MKRDEERVRRIVDGLVKARLDALISTRATNVRLLTGYWPVIGTSVALVTRDGTLGLLVPEDEEDLASSSFADLVHPFRPASLNEVPSVATAAAGPLKGLVSALKLSGGRIGCDSGPASEPATYSASFLYGSALRELIGEVLPAAQVVPADDLLARQRAVLTPAELDGLRAACRLAQRAFAHGRERLGPGLLETEAAACFAAQLGDTSGEEVQRAGGFTFCMSGKNSAQAYRAYARSRADRIAAGDLVLLHCNSYADGLWTDITRTYSLGPPDGRQQAMYDAVLAARQAALGAIRPGTPAAEVDRAARQVLGERGFTAEFKHATGHGVGFGAIDPAARPRLHPRSGDRLEPGMVFNIEPALYMEGPAATAGLRHCDMVVVTDTGAEVLTPFQAEPSALIL